MMVETGLVKYDAMCMAIAACHQVDEVVEIRHQARALEVYAKQAMNTEAERKAIEVRIRAERRSGQILKEMKQSGQRDSGGRGKIESRPTTQLRDLGISKDQSSTWQKLAEVDDNEFEAALASPVKASTEGILAAAGKVAQPAKRHLDPGALWAYGRIAEFERGVMDRPASELYALMPDFQQEHLQKLVPQLIGWLREMGV